MNISKNRNKNKNKIFTVIICLFFLAVIIKTFMPFALKAMGNSLVYETKLEPANIIVVLSGGYGNRTEKAVELYKQKKGKKLLMTGNPIFSKSIPEYMAEYAQELGIPSSDILIEKESLSTYDNAMNSAKIIKKLKAKKVILVTSRFHTKRSYWIFKKALKGIDIKIMVAGAEDHINYQNWWTDHEMSEKVLIEWGKMRLYKFKF
ncbi:YdcF family protein [Candidatus Margulisiibacteriota bacterium]